MSLPINSAACIPVVDTLEAGDNRLAVSLALGYLGAARQPPFLLQKPIV